MGKTTKKVIKENKNNNLKKEVKKVTKEKKFNGETKKTLILFVIIIVLFTICYFIAKIIDSKKVDNNIFSNEQLGTSEIQYDKLIVGTMLNQTSDIYYVLVKYPDDANLTNYETKITAIKEHENYETKLYTVDLADALNKNALVDDVNKASTEIDNLKFNETTLVKVVSGNIAKTYKETNISDKLDRLTTEAKATDK